MKKATQTNAKPAKPVELIIGTSEIGKALESIKNRSAKLDASMVQAALSILHHVELHGDITLANRMLASLGKGLRVNALAAWFCAFGKLKANEDKASKKASPLVYAGDKTTDMESAQATPFWEFKVKEGEPVWSSQAFFSRMLGTLEGALAKATTPEDKERILAAMSALRSPVAESEPALM